MSSEESFLWTSASNSNSDNEDSSSHTQSEMKSELKRASVKNEDEKCKNAKQKILGDNIVKEDSCNYIKDEPTSDIDTKPVKKEHNKSISSNGDLVTFNDSYLNLRVKEEQLSCIDELDTPIKKKKKKKRRTESEMEQNYDCSTADIENNVVHEVCKSEDKSTIEETDITKSHTNEYDQISTSEDTHISKQKKKKKKKRSGGDYNKSNISEITCNSDSDQKGINGHDSGASIHELDSSVRNVSKVSDRIQFEEDLSIHDLNKSIKVDKSMKEVAFNQKGVRKYLKKNTNLQPITSKITLDTVITDNDDVWLLKCPQDVDIMHLKDIPLSLSNKTKFKMAGKVYDYAVDTNKSTLPILTFHEKIPVIKTLTTNGCILLKNKVPKVHIPNHEIMVNEQTNFIPLPETKCRHPLFGIHYKRSVKVPKDIAKRLHESEELNSVAVQDNTKEIKKKHKKNKQTIENDAEFSSHNVKQEKVSLKSKKRKLSSDNKSPVKTKKIKYDPDCAQTWDSEKAIEENLFNF